MSSTTPPALQRRRSPRRSSHRPRRRRALRLALCISALLVGIAVVVAGVVGIWASRLVADFDRGTTTLRHPFPAGERPPTGAGTNILLIGSDARAGTDEPDAGRVRGGRSDSLLLVHLDGDGKGVSVMSILRDSWVDVPGHGTAKINAAYAWGGVALTVQTVERLLDVRVDHVAEIDFRGFKGMTDALGGVDVDVRHAFTARDHSFHTGVNHLDGAAALAFVRERSAFTDGDHQRVRNQQAYLRGLLDRVSSRGTLQDPRRVERFAEATAAHLSVDPGLSARTVANLAWRSRSASRGSVHFFTMPTAGSGTAPDGQSYVVVNEIAVQELSAALRSDTMAAYLAALPAGA